MSANSIIIRALKQNQETPLYGVSEKFLSLMSPHSNHITPRNVDVLLKTPSFKYIKVLYFTRGVKTEDVLRILETVISPKEIYFEQHQEQKIHEYLKDISGMPDFKILHLQNFDYINQPNIHIMKCMYDDEQIKIVPIDKLRRLSATGDMSLFFKHICLNLNNPGNIEKFMSYFNEIEHYLYYFTDELELLNFVLTKHKLNDQIFNFFPRQRNNDFLSNDLLTLWIFYQSLNMDKSLVDFCLRRNSNNFITDCFNQLFARMKSKSDSYYENVAKIIRGYEFSVVGMSIFENKLERILDFCNDYLVAPEALSFHDQRDPRILEYMQIRFLRNPDINLMNKYLQKFLLNYDLCRFFVGNGADPKNINKENYLKEMYFRGIQTIDKISKKILAPYIKLSEISRGGYYPYDFEKYIINMDVKIEGFSSIHGPIDPEIIDNFVLHHRYLALYLDHDFICKSLEKAEIFYINIFGLITSIDYSSFFRIKKSLKKIL